jgi:ribonuclease HI
MALDKVNRLHGITFSWNELGLEYLTGDIEATLTLGPDASEAENQRLWEEIRKYRSAKLTKLTAVLVEAIKEQNAQIQALSSKVASLEAV